MAAVMYINIIGLSDYIMDVQISGLEWNEISISLDWLFRQCCMGLRSLGLYKSIVRKQSGATVCFPNVIWVGTLYT